MFGSAVAQDDTAVSEAEEAPLGDEATATEAPAEDEQTVEVAVEEAAPEAPGTSAQGVEFRFETQPSGTALVLVTDPGFRTHSTVAQGLGPAEQSQVRRVPRPHYRMLCTSPCRAHLPAGIHTFGLTRPSGEVWVSLPPLSLQPDAPMLIRGYVADHAGERLGGPLFLVIGGLAGLGGVIGGMAMMISSQDVLGTTEGLAGLGTTIGSGVLMILAMAVGLPLTFYVDRAWVVGFPLE